MNPEVLSQLILLVASLASWQIDAHKHSLSYNGVRPHYVKRHVAKTYMTKLTRTNLTPRLLCLLFFAALLAPMCSSTANAQSVSGPATVSSSQSCDSSPFATDPLHIPAMGTIYLRLNNQQEQVSTVTTYFQNPITGVCQLLGATSPTYNTWTKLGDYEVSQDNGELTALGQGLSAGPYQATITLLILPKDSLCDPLSGCTVDYRGYSGLLQPLQVSTATDTVDVYIAKPITGVGYSRVDYYADSQFMYGSAELEPFNRAYLSGGIHNITIQVLFKNGEVLNVRQTINMGYDFTGQLWLKSLSYREHDSFLLFLIPAGIILALSSLLALLRVVYLRRRYKINHGLNHYAYRETDNQKQDKNDHVVVG